MHRSFDDLRHAARALRRAVVVGIGATAAFAGWTPARRAMRVDPVQILREG